MNFFNFDIKKILILILALALPLISINVQKSHEDTPWIAQPFQNLSHFATETLFSFSNGIKETTRLYLDLINLKKESQAIQQKNQELTTRLSYFNELNSENSRLRQLLQFKEKTKMDLVAAEVISRDLMGIDHSTLTINKGLDDGILHGQAVITTQGVLGYILRPTKNSAHILLITDRYAVVDGVVQRTRASGIVEGKGNKGCSLKYVEKTEDVKVGDIVVTGGLDNIFPKGFPIAIVESVERKNVSVSLKVDLRPYVDPRQVEEVFVVINAAQENLEIPVPNVEASGSTSL